MPGETHIFDMHLGLRSLVIRELSKYKGNGNVCFQLVYLSVSQTLVLANAMVLND